MRSLAQYIFILLALLAASNQSSSAESKADTSQINAWLKISFELAQINGDSSYILAKKALRASKTLSYKKGISDALLRLGYVSFTRGQYDSASYYLKQSYTICKEEHNIEGITSSANILSYVYKNLGQKEAAFQVLFEALGIIGNENEFDKAYLLIALGNLSINYNDLEGAIKYLEQSENIFINLNDTLNLRIAWGSMGSIYYEENNFEKALHYFTLADSINRLTNDAHSTARNLNNIALCYAGLEQYTDAIQVYFEAKEAYTSLGMKNDLALVLSNIGLAFSDAADSTHVIRYYDSAIHYFEESLTLARELNYTEIILSDIEFLSDVYAAKGDYDKAYELLLTHSRMNDSLLNEEKIKQIAEMQTIYETDQKEQQILLLDAKNKLSSGQRNLFLVASILGLLLASTLLFAWQRTSKEKNRSDDLLLNILPGEVANELMTTGKNEAKLYQNVTVLFTDFVGFTQISQGMSPQELVQEIHKHFTAFDLIMEKHGLEKIKTIGDAYLAVCGLPSETPYHAQRVVLAAIDIIKYVKSHENSFDIRIGINSGPVVAGIVGIKKFAYDIWGDTVNTAARMEQSSEPNRINISQSTFAHVSADFECTYRGQINAKNKGAISMYFVEGKKDGPNLGF